MDYEVRRQLRQWIEEATLPRLKAVPPQTLTKIKNLCRSNAAAIPVAYELLVGRLAHAQTNVRSLTLSIVDQLLARSKAFRQLVVGQLDQLIELVLGPKNSVDVQLKSQLAQVLHNWEKKSGPEQAMIRRAAHFVQPLPKPVTRPSTPPPPIDAIILAKFKRLIQEHKEGKLAAVESCLAELNGCFAILFPSFEEWDSHDFDAAAASLVSEEVDDFGDFEQDGNTDSVSWRPPSPTSHQSIEATPHQPTTSLPDSSLVTTGTDESFIYPEIAEEIYEDEDDANVTDVVRLAGLGSRSYKRVITVSTDLSDMRTPQTEVVFEKLRDLCLSLRREHYPLLTEWTDTLGSIGPVLMPNKPTSYETQLQLNHLLDAKGKLTPSITAAFESLQEYWQKLHLLGIASIGFEALKASQLSPSELFSSSRLTQALKRAQRLSQRRNKRTKKTL